MFYGDMDPITLNAFTKMVTNARTMQTQWLERHRGSDPNGDPRRDLDAECGYPTHQWTSEEYHDLIMREPLACLCNEIYPLESWQVLPQIYEVEDEDVETDLELAWLELPRNIGYDDSENAEKNYFVQEEGSSIYATCLCADILCGEGRHGAILIGLKDGKRLDEPASYKKDQRITFLQAFPEYLCRVTSFEMDDKSPRFGMPATYDITFADPREATGSSVAENYTTQTVHHTRVVHIVDRWHTATPSRVFAIPRLRVLRDPLLDIRKLRASDPEMYYKAAFMGLHFGTHPQLGADVFIDTEALKDMYEEYVNGLQRGVFTNGMTVDPLAPTISDPDPHFLLQVQNICAKTRVPKRTMLGSEIGERSSEEDKIRWNGRLRSRHHGHNTPSILAPLINRFIWLGCLPKPKKEVRAFWPDIATQTDAEKATALLTKTQAYAAYVAGNIAEIIPPLEYMTKIDTFDKETAEAIIEAAEELQIEQAEEDQALADEMGLEPEIEGFTKPEPDPIELEREKAKAKAQFSRNSEYTTEENDFLERVLGNCGGPGSGVPGPCPSGMSDDKDVHTGLTNYAKKKFKEESDVKVRETAGVLWLSWHRSGTDVKGAPKARASYPIGTRAMGAKYLKSEIERLHKE